MKSLYNQGIQANRDTYWMGQAAAPAGNWLTDLFKTGGQAFSSFEGAQAAEDIRKAAEANKAAADAQRAAAAASAAAGMPARIMGIPAGTFWLGAAGLGALGIIAAVALSKK